MTFEPTTACILLHTLLLLITTPRVLLSAELHYDHASNVWDRHSGEEPFRTLWNVSLQECVTACQLRKACRAVNYCRTRLSCQLLETDAGGALVSQNVTEEFNVFVRMSDVRMTPAQAMAMSACSSCTVNQTCVPDTSSCVLTECRRLDVANGVIFGNMVSVDARVKVECAAFYKLDPPSQDQTVCQADGQWLPTITCVPDTACGPPLTIAAATAVTFTNVSNVISAVYECDAGYDTPSAFSDMSVECLSNTTWGAIGFECLADCGAPPNVTLATVSTAGGNLAGVIKTYTCNTGHAVNGSATVTCQQDATWSQIQFECIADCGTPPPVLNGAVLPGATVEESIRNYTCNAGYAPNSTTTLVTCQMDGSWTAVEFECIIDCGVPSAITNADVSAGGTSEGDIRTYTCITDHVFRNLGNADITCQADSTWSTASFDCLWDCGPAPNVSDAAVAVSDTVEASTGTYTCDTGYVANDTATITCQAGSTWSGVAFYCVVDCGTPGAITNAVILPGATTEGSTNSYTCATNYAAQNVVTMDTTCQANGTWSTPSFDCVPDCGAPATITNAVISAGGTIEGETRTYSCITGYVFRDLINADITCRFDGTWSAASFGCLWDCGPVPTVANAMAAAGDTIQNTVRGYTCTTGYAASGSTQITCQTGSTWTAVAFTCAADCGSPPTEANAVVQPGSTLEGTSRTYTCDTGYAATTSATITCQGAGTWTPASFACVVDCGTPTAYPNAGVSVGGTGEGATRSYSCDSGYVFRNDVTTTTTCQSDSTWSVPSFDCLWDCGAATFPVANADALMCTDTVTGSTCTYTCSTGYTMSGVPTVTCQDAATWTSVAFTCYVDCGSPAAYPGAQVSGGGSAEGDTRTYSCLSGYGMHNVGDDTTTCLVGSTWSVPSFVCLYDCGTPPSMSFGTVSGGGSVPGSTRTYTCDSGYGTAGSATITCQDGTGWSAPTSTCTALACDAGWHKIGLSCYFKAGSNTEDVFTSRDICHSYNAYLVQLETQTEANDVENWFFGVYDVSVWVGITDTVSEGTWVWMNSSVPATWTDWDTSNSQPNGGTGDNFCRLRTERNWGDISWDSDREILCEKGVHPV